MHIAEVQGKIQRRSDKYHYMIALHYFLLLGSLTLDS